MGQRKIERIDADALFAEWQADIERIKQDTHELFSLRQTFRDLREIFIRNRQLQEDGGYLWDWMRVNYAASVLIRLRRELDTQNNVISLRKLLDEIVRRPDVITRGRRKKALGFDQLDGLLAQLLDREFTENWVGDNRQPGDDDSIDPAVVSRDIEELEKAAERVAAVANSSVAHRTRREIEDAQVRDVDDAMAAIERFLKKYYALLCGSSLIGAEPVRQFNAHKVFTYPWDDTMYAKWAACPTCSDVDWTQIQKPRSTRERRERSERDNENGETE